jgi:hypothetical protein
MSVTHERNIFSLQRLPWLAALVAAKRIFAG